ncbi:hypothetical protein [Burkholderia aenigmatica]|uniref:hypothetical protein n=1 Tax=Burkholderia aenigmatica TaxID=2015348 RepID=UPI0015C5905F|nr:hypothetical protein [Burkholderia aenigmatica]
MFLDEQRRAIDDRRRRHSASGHVHFGKTGSRHDSKTLVRVGAAPSGRDWLRRIGGGREQEGGGGAGDLADLRIDAGGCAGGKFDGGNGDAAYGWLPDPNDA